ncbi:NAD-dependent deacylase [Bacteroidota bacterium]
MLDKKRPHLVALTGAGMSAESGLQTFRDADGLWEGYNVYDVATPEAWQKNPQLVQEFYNARRKAVLEANPNQGHILLRELEHDFDVDIITQNIDNLHERAGSNKVLHLHGEITFARSSVDPDLLYKIDGWELKMGQKCKLGSQLRPHVVWFGESVPMIEPAARLSSDADIYVVIGTSLQVYPAAGLLNYVPKDVPVFLIDPKPISITRKGVVHIQEKAAEGVRILSEQLKTFL